MTAARGALCAAATLLLLAAAGCHATSGCAHLREAADAWAADAQQRVAAWWAAARAPTAAADGADWTLVGGMPGGATHQPSGIMHVTLELPDGRRLGIGEDASLKQLVAHLLQEQTGLTPTSVELLSVEHMRRRRASPLRAVLRAAAALRHPSTWRLPGTAAEQPAAAGIADDARTEVSELAAALAADADAAAQDGSMPALLQLAQPRGAGSEEPPVPLTEALVAQKTAAALAASARQLPAGLWVEAAEEEERRTASGRKLRQDPLALPCQRMRLFGPARSAAELLEEAERGAAPVAPALVLHVVVVEQRASRQQCLWSLLARLAKDASLAAADGNADGGSAAADDSDAASSSGSSTGMDSAAQHASLLNLLDQAELLEAPLPLALGGPTPPLLSARRAGPLADGIPVAGLLEPFGPTPLRRRPVQPRPPAQQQRARGAGVSPLALAAVDTVFVAACGVALVCAVLLVADIWCNGWRGGGDGPARGCSAYPAGCLVAGSKAAQQLTVPLLVVAAEEVEQAGGCGRRIY